MISFEHQGWTVQIFASAAPARPLIVLPTFAEAVAPVREALADASDFTLVALSGFDWEGDLSPWPAPALGKNSMPFAGHADAALALPERGVAAADRSCASSAAKLARHRRLFAGGTFCRVRALSLRSFSARCQHEWLAVVSGFSGFRSESCHARQAGADLSLRRAAKSARPAIHSCATCRQLQKILPPTVRRSASPPLFSSSAGIISTTPPVAQRAAFAGCSKRESVKKFLLRTPKNYYLDFLLSAGY